MGGQAGQDWNEGQGRKRMSDKVKIKKRERKVGLTTLYRVLAVKTGLLAGGIYCGESF